MFGKNNLRKIVGFFVATVTFFAAIQLCLPTAIFATSDQANNYQQNASGLLEISNLPEFISSENVMQFKHKSRIDDSELDSIKFINADNSISVYKFSENIRFIDENGIIKDKSNDLTLQYDGSYQNELNDVKLSFPKFIHDGITMSFDDITIVMTPVITKSVIDKDIKNTNPIIVNYIPESSNTSINEVSYNNVFDNSSTIIYTPLYSGVKESTIFFKRPDSNKIEYLFELTNASLSNKTDYIEILDVNQNVIGQITPIVVISANNKISNGSYSVTVVNDDTYKVTIELDSTFLNSDDTLYPIIVDPTIESVTGTSKNIIDATLYQNQDLYTTGTIQYNNVGYLLNDNFGYSRSIIKFPGLMNDVTFCMIPNERLTSVYLYMYCVEHTNNSTVTAYQYTGSSTWTETNVTSGLPATYSTSLSASKTITSGSSSSPYLVSFNITDLIKSWKTNNSLSDYGLLLKNANETNTNYLVRFASSDASTNRPYIVYNYTQSNTFNIKNVYSSKFLNGVGSNAVSYINGACSFIDKVFSETFNVSFNNSSTTLRTSLIDNCSLGRDSACNSTCGSNCLTTHHRNATRYANDIYSISKSSNDIYIAWDYASRNTICDYSNHTLIGAMALVTAMPNTITRGIIVPSKYWDGMNTICIFEPSLSFSSQYYESSMKLISAHEMAHVMGIYDTYGNGAGSDHLVNSSEWTCIMRSFNYSEAGRVFVNNIEQGKVDPFCSYCENLISSVINTRYFPAS